MRVLILNHNIRERGTYFRARRVAEGLHARGHHVTFVCSGAGWYRWRQVERRPRWDHWESASGTLFGLEEGYASLGLLQRVLRLARRWDLIYTFSHFPIDQGVAGLLRARGGFWMTDWCDLWDSRNGGLHDWRHWDTPPPLSPRGLAMRASFRFDDALECAAPAMADALSIIATPMADHARRLGVPAGRTLHLVSGADTDAIAPMDQAAARAALGIAPDRPVLVYMANVTPDNDLLEGALAHTWRRDPRVLLLSIGPRWFGNHGFMKNQETAGRAIDGGRQPFAKVAGFLAAGDALLLPMRDLPYNQCRWPNKMGDHMAAGRPTALTRVGDMATVAREHDLGTVGAPTPRGLADAIEALLGDPERARRLGRNAHAAAMGPFSWKTQVDRLVAFLRTHGVDA